MGLLLQRTAVLAEAEWAHQLRPAAQLAPRQTLQRQQALKRKGAARVGRSFDDYHSDRSGSYDQRCPT